MYSQPRFGLVTPEMVRGALKATGSTDPDVLAAAIDQFAAPYRPLKWFGIWALVTGTLCCLLIILAIIGIPLLIFGFWALKRAKKNAAVIATEYEAFLAGASGRPRAATAGPGGAGGLAAMGITLALVAGTAGAAVAQNEEVPPEYRGDYVRTAAACGTPLRLRLGVNRMTLVNGRDSAVFRDLDFMHSYWGNSYEGIQFVSMPEYTRSTASHTGEPPFLVIFNADEKKGMLRVTDLAPALQRRFPIGDTPLKHCGGSSGTRAAAAPRQAPGCEAAPRCAEGTTFAATITDVRTSVAGYDRVVTVTLRIRNRMDRPLTLAYVQQSGIVTDDRGNRYLNPGGGAVRGLGEITSRGVDPKFTLAAGESADARLEFSWRPTRGVIHGTEYNLDVALRELDPLPGEQWQLGREHALQYRGLVPTGAQAAAANDGATERRGDGATAVLASCGERPRCFASGSFTADVVNVVPSVAGRHHVVQFTLKVTNASDAPLYLGYTSNSSGAVDDLGNRYYFGRAGTHDVSFRGIGLVTSRAADPQFRVDPGASRTATFSVTRFEGARGPHGTSWTWDLALEELEILPSRQVRSARQHAVSFPDLRAGASAADPGAAARGLVDGVKKLLGGKK